MKIGDNEMPTLWVDKQGRIHLHKWMREEIELSTEAVINVEIKTIRHSKVKTLVLTPQGVKNK